MNKQNNGKHGVYLAPQIEVIEVENEGIMALSSEINGLENGGTWTSGTSARSRSNTNSLHATSALSDIEDLLNEILTY